MALIGQETAGPAVRGDVHRAKPGSATTGRVDSSSTSVQLASVPPVGDGPVVSRPTLGDVGEPNRPWHADGAACEVAGDRGSGLVIRGRLEARAGRTSAVWTTRAAVDMVAIERRTPDPPSSRLQARQQRRTGLAIVPDASPGPVGSATRPAPRRRRRRGRARCVRSRRARRRRCPAWGAKRYSAPAHGVELEGRPDAVLGHRAVLEHDPAAGAEEAREERVQVAVPQTRYRGPAGSRKQPSGSKVATMASVSPAASARW